MISRGLWVGLIIVKSMDREMPPTSQTRPVISLMTYLSLLYNNERGDVKSSF